MNAKTTATSETFQAAPKKVYEIVLKTQIAQESTSAKQEKQQLIFHYLPKWHKDNNKQYDLIYLVKWNKGGWNEKRKSYLLSLNVEDGTDRFISSHLLKTIKNKKKISTSKELVEKIFDANLDKNHHHNLVAKLLSEQQEQTFKYLKQTLKYLIKKLQNNALIALTEENKNILKMVCEAFLSQRAKIHYSVHKIDKDSAKHYTYTRNKKHEEMKEAEKEVSNFKLLFGEDEDDKTALIHNVAIGKLKQLLEKVDYSGKTLYLPFIPMQNKITFPLDIDTKAKIPDRYDESFVSQKAYFAVGGTAFFNGNNVRVLSIDEKNKMTVGHCGYFDVQASADCLHARLKAYIHKAEVEGCGDAIEKYNKFKKEYEKRILKIDSNCFNGTNFSSGLGFSMPIFLIRKEKDEERLEVLYARGSEGKASGADLLHVAPAGMLEIYENKKGDLGEITYKNFVTVLAKELLEELYFGKGLDISELDDKTKELIEPFFESEGASPAKRTFTEYLLDEKKIAQDETWNKIWEKQKNKPSNKVLQHVLEKVIDPNYCEEHAFLAVDPLVLRPELIVPIYVRGERFEAMLNWEYNPPPQPQKHSQDIPLRPWGGSAIEGGFKGWLEFLNTPYIASGKVPKYKQFAAPGLAAVYLGAEHYFKNKGNKDFENDICKM